MFADNLLQALAKVEIRVNGRRILASLNLVDDPSIVGCDELGLSEDAFAQLGAEPGVPASISQAEPAPSIPALHRKIAGERLRREDFHAIIRAQGAKPFDHQQPPRAALTHEVLAERDAAVIGIDNLQLARIARLAGAPKVQGAGVDLLCKLGQNVRAGEVLYRVYADFPADLAFARQACERASGFTLGLPEQVPSVFVEF